MGKDNELREWALNHWKVYRSKYTGEVIDFKKSSLENWRQLELEKPISLIPKKTIKSIMLIFVVSTKYVSSSQLNRFLPLFI